MSHLDMPSPPWPWEVKVLLALFVLLLVAWVVL